MSDQHPDVTKVEGLPARRPSAILAEMVRLRQREQGPPAPFVTLHLMNGRDLSGWIVDLVEGESLVLQLPGPNLRQPGFDVTYLEPRMVAAVTVHDAARAAAALSAGKVPSAPSRSDKPAPTRLELKRDLAARQATVQEKLGYAVVLEVDWGIAPTEGEPLRDLGELIHGAVEALLTVAREDLGREALREKVERVRFASADRAMVALSGRTLTITARLAFGAEGRLAPGDLVSAIEKAL